MVLQLALKDYLENFKFNLLFGILLIFTFFALFENIFVGSGSIFLEYNISSVDLTVFAVELLSIIVFLVFYSLFLSFMLFNVRNKLNQVRLNYYLSEKLHKFGFSLALFFVLYFLFFFIFYSVLVFFEIPFLLITLLLFILSIFLLFVPQSIVIDEGKIIHSMQNSFEFLVKDPVTVLKVIVLGTVLLLFVPFIEFVFDFVFFIGNYVSLLVVLFFIVPFIEIVKTRLYMEKFSLALVNKNF